MTEKEVDTVVAFLKEKKKEGHFRAMWKAYGELVNLMASEEVWIADAWWPVVVEVASKGIPVRYAVAKEGYRAWCNGYAICRHSQEPRCLLRVAELLDGGLPRRAAVGDRLLLDGEQLREVPRSQAGASEVYGGEGRDGGSLADRAQRVFVWNTRPKNLEYYTEKWNEFLAA